MNHISNLGLAQKIEGERLTMSRKIKPWYVTLNNGGNYIGIDIKSK